MLHYQNEILSYLLIGVIVSFILESLIRWGGENVNGWERFSLIVAWPIMLCIFVYQFIKGLIE
jgi:hypothetical protein